VNAKIFADTHGENLIGMSVMTERIGAYPGGIATVIEINPDPDAGIVLKVKHPTFGEIGIFDSEEIYLAQCPST
jgi:hypothetical protein